MWSAFDCDVNKQLKKCEQKLIYYIVYYVPSNLEVKAAPHSAFNLLSMDFSLSTLADLPTSNLLARSFL